MYYSFSHIPICLDFLNLRNIKEWYTCIIPSHIFPYLFESNKYNTVSILFTYSLIFWFSFYSRNMILHHSFSHSMDSCWKLSLAPFSCTRPVALQLGDRTCTSRFKLIARAFSMQTWPFHLNREFAWDYCMTRLAVNTSISFILHGTFDIFRVIFVFCFVVFFFGGLSSLSFLFSFRQSEICMLIGGILWYSMGDLR